MFSSIQAKGGHLLEDELAEFSVFLGTGSKKLWVTPLSDLIQRMQKLVMSIEYVSYCEKNDSADRQSVRV